MYAAAAAVGEDVYTTEDTTATGADMFGFADPEESSYSESSEDCASEGSNADVEQQHQRKQEASTGYSEASDSVALPTATNCQALPHHQHQQRLLHKPSHSHTATATASTSPAYGVPPFGSPTYTPRLNPLQQQLSEQLTSAPALPHSVDDGSATNSISSSTSGCRLEPISEILSPLRFSGYAGDGGGVHQSWATLSRPLPQPSFDMTDVTSGSDAPQPLAMIANNSYSSVITSNGSRQQDSTDHVVTTAAAYDVSSTRSPQRERTPTATGADNTHDVITSSNYPPLRQMSTSDAPGSVGCDVSGDVTSSSSPPSAACALTEGNATGLSQIPCTSSDVSTSIDNNNMRLNGNGLRLDTTSHLSSTTPVSSAATEIESSDHSASEKAVHYSCQSGDGLQASGSLLVSEGSAVAALQADGSGDTCRPTSSESSSCSDVDACSSGHVVILTNHNDPTVADTTSASCASNQHSNSAVSLDGAVLPGKEQHVVTSSSVAMSVDGDRLHTDSDAGSKSETSSTGTTDDSEDSGLGSLSDDQAAASGASSKLPPTLGSEEQDVTIDGHIMDQHVTASVD